MICLISIFCLDEGEPVLTIPGDSVSNEKMETIVMTKGVIKIPNQTNVELDFV